MPNISCGFDFIYRQHLFPLKVSLKAKFDILSVAKDIHSRLIFVWKFIGSNYGSMTWKNPQLLSFGSNWLSNILNYHRTMNYHRDATKGLCIKLFKLSGNGDQPQQFVNLWNTCIYGRNVNSVLYALLSVYFLFNSSSSIIRSKS